MKGERKWKESKNCYHREKVKPYYEPVINLPWEEKLIWSKVNKMLSIFVKNKFVIL